MRQFWTPYKISLLRKLYPHTSTKIVAEKVNMSIYSCYNKAYFLGLKKTKKFLGSKESGIFIKGSKIGKNTQFKKGHIPINKGKKQSEYMSPEAIEKSKKYRYKKGNIPKQTLYDGAITIRNDKRGIPHKYIRIAKAKWVELQIHNWSSINGNIPKGMILSCIDGNTMNCEPDNWKLITKKENMLRNTIHQYPEEIKSTIRLISKLTKIIDKHGEK